jgi:anthranilate synthase component 2
VQFHPESIASEHGHRLLGNFLRLAGLNLTGRAAA